MKKRIIFTLYYTISKKETTTYVMFPYVALLKRPLTAIRNVKKNVSFLEL
jgi:hypothetical protein